MPTFDLEVGQNYQVTNGLQSASFEFLGMYSNRSERMFLFNNPNGLGTPFPLIGATPEIVYPANGTGVVTITVRLKVKYVGESPSNMTLFFGPQSSWTPT